MVNNTHEYNNLGTNVGIKGKLWKDNPSEASRKKREEKGMQPSTYIIKSNTQTQRWGQDVIDLVVTEDSADVKYTMFVTSENIYEVKVFGATEDSFVKQTAKQIFDNLRFQN